MTTQRHETSHVAVCIVGYDNPDDIESCLQSLNRSCYSNFEVLICENGGNAAFRELCRRVPKRLPGGQTVSVVESHTNVGFAGGVNRCMRETNHADAWWILNPDTKPEAGALAALVARLERGNCEAVGGIVYQPNGKVRTLGGIWSWRSLRAVSLGYGSNLNDPVRSQEVEGAQNYLSGASMLVSRSFAERAGSMREDYFLYCEEIDWCLRACAAGARLGFAKDARVEHTHGTTTGSGTARNQLPKLVVFLGERNRLLLVRDHRPGRFIFSVPLAIVQLGFRYAAKSCWRQFGYGLQGIVAAVRNERGRPDWLSGAP